ncbi:hypothetical protein [Streptomyces sp. NPDC005438]|uniref:hypothetical protein n=1 Tax=Streptomyces sp. NPDC005438 TaxID=3156880 RepID=UPI00339EEC77
MLVVGLIVSLVRTVMSRTDQARVPADKVAHQVLPAVVPDLQHGRSGAPLPALEPADGGGDEFDEIREAIAVLHVRWSLPLQQSTVSGEALPPSLRG